MSSNSQERRRHVVGGRLVNRAPGFSLDLGRCVIVLSVCLALWFSNPANDNEQPLYRGVGVTNYGLFSIWDRGDRISFHAATLRADCHLPPPDPSEPNAYFTSTRSLYGNDAWYDDLYYSLCVQVQQSMAHEKPLLWAPRDFPHTVHRILCAMLVLMTLLVSCCRNKSSSFTGNLFLDSFIGMFVHVQNPLEGLLWSLVRANLYLYPVWTVMNKVIPLQREASMFRVVEQPMGVNFAISASVVFILAAAVHAGAKHLSSPGSSYYYLLPGLDGVVAVGIGYYRAIYGNEARPDELQWFRNVSFLRDATWIPGFNATSLTWFLLIQVFMQQSIPGVVAFVVNNMLGFHMGNYQRMNMSTFAAFESLFQELRDGFASLFSF